MWIKLICSALFLIGNLRAIAADTSVCDLSFSGVSFGEYQADNAKPATTYGKLGVICNDANTHNICIAADPSGTAVAMTPCVPNTTTADCSDKSRAIFYNLYQPTADHKITDKIWGADKSKLSGEPYGLFCFTAATCTPEHPCEFPVKISTDTTTTIQGSSQKLAGSYSYASSSATIPRFFLYYLISGVLTASNVQLPIMVNAYVGTGCSVTASPFHFGSVADTTFNQCVVRNDLIKVNCNVASYSVSLIPENAGIYSGICGLSQNKCMVNLSSNPWQYLVYDLYPDQTCSSPWTTKTYTKTPGSTWESIPVYGKIIRKSSGANPGYYEDVMNVVVEYTKP